MPLLTLHGLKVAFGDPPLLDGVDLQVEAGDRLCLLGRNGAGKSTLLKIIGGQLEADGGQRVTEPGLKIASVDQEVPADLGGTVFEVVASGLGEATALLARYHQVSQEVAHEATEKRLAELEQLQHELERTGGFGLHLSVERVLRELRLDSEDDFASLSGGTKRRVLLARALVSAPDILILDEPTNHLDIETIGWLEDFLRRSTETVLFVTHDRVFARSLANRVAELDRGRLYTFGCGYDEFVGRREALLEAEITRRALFDKKLAQEEVWIRKGIQARRTRNEGRVRALQKMREAYRQRRLSQGKAKLHLQEAGRSGTLVAEAREATFAYPGGEPIVREFSTTIARGDRVGIIGANGSGKTTLLGLLLGQLEPQSGEIRQGTRREVVYFDQLREQLDLEKTVQENVGEGLETLQINGQPRHVIGYLQDFLFSAERARTPVKVLSGGEKNRLLLAKLFTRPSNVLVMDEPTNDLDIETLGLLEDLLAEYTGTLLLVSHDREFLDNVVTSTLSVGADGRVQEYAGGYADALAQMAASAPEASSESTAAPKKEKKKKPVGDRPRKLSFKERRELEALPETIATLEAEQESLHASMADPEFYKRAATAAVEVKTRLEALETLLEQAYARWEELEALVEAGSA